jgi:fructokinase
VANQRGATRNGMLEAPTQLDGVLVVGEAVIKVQGDEEHERTPSGSLANVAIALKRLGTPTSLLTCIAPDEDGMRLVHHLLDVGVVVMPQSFSAKRTSIVSQLGYREHIEWSLPDVETIPLAPVLHVGSYGAFFGPGATTVRRLVKRANRAGVVVTFDPNIQPDLLPDRAGARKQFERIASRSTIVKLCRDDAEWLYPGETHTRS